MKVPSQHIDHGASAMNLRLFDIPELFGLTVLGQKRFLRPDYSEMVVSDIVKLIQDYNSEEGRLALKELSEDALLNLDKNSYQASSIRNTHSGYSSSSLMSGIRLANKFFTHVALLTAGGQRPIGNERYLIPLAAKEFGDPLFDIGVTIAVTHINGRRIRL